MYNDVQKTTTLDFRDYLLPAAPLAPGATAKGLVFFKLPDGADRGHLRLAFEPQSED
jgi:hypothetical protein